VSKIFQIYRGIPASGKTTAALAQQAEKPEIIRVNRDDLRKAMFGLYWGASVDEGAVTTVQHEALRAAFATGRPVISDSTNLTNKHVVAQIKIALEAGYGYEYVDFPVTLDVALARDEQRDKPVGPRVIRDFHNRFVVDKESGLFRPGPVVEPLPTFTPYSPGMGLPPVILVDIDGTLANHEGVRNPYDTSRYHLDGIHYDVVDLARAYCEHWGVGMVIMSGRDAAFREVTEEWLLKGCSFRKGFDYIDLFMRPEGDRRNDAVVKDELFEKHIVGQYNVDFVLDDRDRVVSMWRAKGLRCFQVAEGNF
jgi:predicted kinase